MIKGSDVLEYLRPDGGWTISGDSYEGIIFFDCEPLTENQFEQGFDLVLAHRKEETARKSAAKAALLEKLGITEEEAKLLLS